MSSWARTSKAQQRVHKERSQPESRQKLGFLEKKKDYKIRAVDHERKQNTIKALRQKALDKNPDEFYFHMVNSKVVDGKHVEKPKEEEATDAQKRLMKSQDLSYVRSKRMAETRKIERLKASLATTFVDHSRSKHTYFASSDDDKRLLRESLQGKSDIKTTNEPQSKLSESEKDLAKERKKAVKELAQRIERERELRIIEEKLQVRKNLLEKRTPVKVQEGTKESPAVYKWTFQRKR